jgi:hypothetical protein
MARLVVVAYSSCELATEKYYHMVNISLKSTMELFDHMEIILVETRVLPGLGRRL